MVKPGVFISYRRKGGRHLAGRISDYLEENGFDPFLDVDGLRSGQFDVQILKEIARRKHFLLICTQDALAGCSDGQDWVRIEIAHAIKTQRDIVPVVDSGFSWPDRKDLPPDIADICVHHAFEYSHTHWKATRSKLLARLSSARVPPPRTEPPRADRPSPAPTATSDASVTGEVQRSRPASAHRPATLVQAVELYRLRAEDAGTPESLHELATSLEQLARAQLSQREFEEALASGTECLGIRRTLMAGRPGSLESEQELGSIISVVARIELARGSAPAALVLFLELVENRRAFLGRLPDDAALRLVNDALRELAEAQVIARDLAAARASCEERVELARRYAKVVGASQGRSDVSEALEALARVELALGEGDRALAAAAESLEIRRRRVIERASGSVGLELAATLEMVADVRLSMGSREEALTLLREAAGSAGRSARGLIGDRASKHARALALLLGRVAALELDCGDRDGARSASSESFRGWTRWLKRGDVSSEDADAIARLVNVRARLQVDVDGRLIELAERILAGAGRLRIAEEAAAAAPFGSRLDLNQERGAMRKLLAQIAALD